MLKGIKSILFVILAVMVFVPQSARCEDKDKGREHSSAPKSAPRPAPVMHNTQSKPHVVQSRREAPQHMATEHRTQAIVQVHESQPARQERRGAHVYAVPAPAPEENNRLLHRQHHNHWQPRYNFYDNQYHFYPYVNIASLVELSGGYLVAGPDGQNYYYDQGTFYLADPSGQYLAVAPPVGIIVNPIVDRARQITVDGQIFYRYKGVFYVQVQQGYQVVGPVEPVVDNS